MQMEFKDGRSAMHEHQRGRPVSLSLSLSLCAVTHIVIHYSKPPLLLMPLLLNGKAVFFSPARAQRRTQIIRRDGRGREEEEKARKWHKWPHYFLLSLSLSQLPFSSLWRQKGVRNKREIGARVTYTLDLG